MKITLIQNKRFPWGGVTAALLYPQWLLSCLRKKYLNRKYGRSR